MVSLARDNNGYFGDHDDRPIIPSTHYMDNSTDDEMTGSNRSNRNSRFQLICEPEVSPLPIRTPYVIFLAKTIYVLLGVSCYVLPVICERIDCKENPLTLTIYIHGASWFLFFLIDCVLGLLHAKHHRMGYLKFFLATKRIKRVPLLISSCANAALLIVDKVLQHFCTEEGECKFLTSTRYVQILISSECLFALIVLTIYFVRTVRYNRRKDYPDIIQDDLNSGSENPYLIEIGFRTSNYTDQVLEKQAYMIRHLREKINYLAAEMGKLCSENQRQAQFIGACNQELDRTRLITNS